jgi:hypothetical protein
MKDPVADVGALVTSDSGRSGAIGGHAPAWSALTSTAFRKRIVPSGFRSEL